MKYQLFLACIAINIVIADYFNAQQLPNSNLAIRSLYIDLDQSEMLIVPLVIRDKPIVQFSADSDSRLFLFPRGSGSGKQKKGSQRGSQQGSQGGGPPFQGLKVAPDTPSTSQRTSAHGTAGTGSSRRTSFFTAEGRQSLCNNVKEFCTTAYQAVKQKPELIGSALKTTGAVLGLAAYGNKDYNMGDVDDMMKYYMAES